MKVKQASNSGELYTSTETRKKLGVSASTLTNLVNKGIIEKIIPPGYQHGFYTKRSVDEYYKQQNIFVETYSLTKDKKLEVRKATREDQSLIFDMEKNVLGYTIPIEKRLEWYDKNHDIDFIAVSHGKVLGHLSLIPFTSHMMQLIMEGKIKGEDIPADSIETYEPNKIYSLFIMAMAVQKSESTGKMHAGLLIREAQENLFNMAKNKILISKIYATSRTRDGIYMAQRLNMDAIPEWSTAHRKAFVLDMSKSNSRWAREYRNFASESGLSRNSKKELIAE